MQRHHGTESDGSIGRGAKIRSVEHRGVAGQNHHRDVSDISPSSAAAAPKMLSRPIVATSTICPSERRTITEMAPLCGK